MDGRAKGREHQKKRITAMSNPSDQESGGWLESPGFGALDWASEKHSVVVVDSQGKVLEDFEIEHSALGWKKFRERVRPYGSIPFAIETSQGVAGGQTFERGQAGFFPNPQKGQTYPENTKPPGGEKHRMGRGGFFGCFMV